MALTQAALATKIKDEIEANAGKSADDPTELDNFAQALAKAIVDELKANAQVVVAGGSSAGTYGIT